MPPENTPETIIARIKTNQSRLMVAWIILAVIAVAIQVIIIRNADISPSVRLANKLVVLISIGAAIYNLNLLRKSSATLDALLRERKLNENRQP